MRMSVRRSYLDNIAEVQAPDPMTVVVRLKQKQPLFINFFSQPEVIVAIIPAEEAAKDANRIEVIGTGPYRLAEYRPDSHVRLVRFDGYASRSDALADRCHLGVELARTQAAERGVLVEQGCDRRLEQ